MRKRKGVVHFVETLTAFLGGHLMGYLLLFLILMILVEVLTRYIFRIPMSMAEEFGGYILVTITVVGLGFTWKEGGHVRVTFLVDRFPLKVRNWIRLCTVTLAAIVSLLFIKASYEMVWYSHFFGTRSGTALRTPLKWPQMVLIVGAGLLFIQLLVEVYKMIRAIRESRKET